MKASSPGAAQKPRLAGWTVAGVVAAGFAVRLAWVLAVPNLQWSDVAWYEAAGRHLATHYELVFPREIPARAWFPPGWPFFLAVVYWLTGYHAITVKLVNLVLASLTIYLTVRVGARVFGPAAAVAGGLFLSLLPGQVAYVSLAQYEVFLTALVAAILCLCVETDWARARWPSLPLHLLGIATAWATMTRPPLVFLPALLGFYLGRQSGDRRRGWTKAGIVALYVAAACLAWGVRNRLVLGQPVLFSTNGGYNFWHGNNPRATGGAMVPPPTSDPRMNPSILRDEVAINRAGYRYGWEYLREHPLRCLAQVPRRVYYLYWTDTTGLYLAFVTSPMDGPGLFDRLRHSRLPEALAFRSYQLVLLLAVFGALLADWRSSNVRLLAGFVGYWTISCAVTFGQDRYHVPLMPVLCLFAGLPVQRLLQRHWPRRGQRA